MFQPLLVEVKSVGEDVVIAVGSWNCRLFFETAVLLAAWMDECARDAKAWASDTKRLLKGVGTLHDASDKNWLNKGQPFTPNGVPRVNRDLLKKHQIEVRAEGGLVSLTAGTAMMQIPYQAALQISQWIRVRAKESQTRAGDVTRHWSKIKREHETQHGPGVTHG
jgi:hypothetical protein